MAFSWLFKRNTKKLIDGYEKICRSSYCMGYIKCCMENDLYFDKKVEDDISEKFTDSWNEIKKTLTTR